MERIITDKERERITNFGAFGYDYIQCACILGWDEKEVLSLMNDKKTEFYKLYEKGKIKAEYVIDLKLFEQAQSGDLKSLDKLNARKRKRANQNSKR